MSKELKTYVKPIQVNLICDCGEVMKFTGLVHPTNPPEYQYSCPKCAKEEWVGNRYPYIHYEPDLLGGIGL